MERRRFLASLTAASLGVVLDSSFTRLSRAQNIPQSGSASNSQASHSKMSGSPQTQRSSWCMLHGLTAPVGATSFCLWNGMDFALCARLSR